MERRDLLTVITAGGRWRDARGIVYVVTWVKKIGVLGYRRDAPGEQRELVSDVVRFVLGFVPAQGHARPANA